MRNCFKRDYLLNIEYCNSKATISPLAVLTIFQSMTTLNAEYMGISSRPLSDGKFWLITHNRVDFYNTAFYLDTVNGQAWFESGKPDDKRMYQGYSLKNDEDLIALGRTQFACLDSKGQILPFRQCGLPADIDYDKSKGLNEEPTHFIDDFTDDDFVCNYTVRPTDLDFGKHMNNIAYVRVLLDTLTAKKLANNSIRSIEIHYFAQSFESEKLSLYAKKENNKIRYCLKKEDGKNAILAHILFH